MSSSAAGVRSSRAACLTPAAVARWCCLVLSIDAGSLIPSAGVPCESECLRWLVWQVRLPVLSRCLSLVTWPPTAFGRWARLAAWVEKVYGPDMDSHAERPIAIIGAPSSAGAYAPGQERAPAALREADLPGALERQGRTVQDRGDLPVFRWRVDHDSPRARNPGAVVAMIEGVRDTAVAALGDGSAVLVLGGDCTTGLGSIAALLAINKDAGLVYLDLHADMNVPSSVTDGALDWMGLGHAFDLPGALPEVAASCSLTGGEVVLCGYSEMNATAFEREHVARLGLSTVSDRDVAADPVAAARRALARLGDRGSLAVHFDVDLVDFGQVPLSEHTGANQGIGFEQALAALGELLTDPRVQIVTVTEHNPLHGAPDGSDTRRLADALATAFAAV